MRSLSVLVFLCGVVATASAQAREPIVGLPCEGCEAVFDGMPADLAPRARIAPIAEPGEPMLVTGRVRELALVVVRLRQLVCGALDPLPQREELALAVLEPGSHAASLPAPRTCAHRPGASTVRACWTPATPTG